MKNAATVSLFERLIDEDPDESFEKHPKKFLNFRELQESLARDLSRLLNTRVSQFWKDNFGKTTVPYSYGVNITAPASAENVFEIHGLESNIDDAIRRFEPRLINAKSHVIGTYRDPSRVFIDIEATINIENRKTQLSFPIAIDI
jgi:type VI secretion system lysozyme-like protein